MAIETERALFDWVTAQLERRGLAAGEPGWSVVSADASARRFYRIRYGGPAGARSWVAMDAPPASENNAQFLRLSALFREHGVHVPAVIASDLERGFLLVEDLGERRYDRIYRAGDVAAKERAIEAALVTLLRIQRIARDDELVPPYTATRFREELGLFRGWLLEGLLGIVPSAAERQLLERAFTLLIDNMRQQPQCCVHRDFHSRNLLLDEDDAAALVDFQDALWGPLAYDPASLLRDCYERFGEDEIERWRVRYLEMAREAGIVARHDGERFARELDRSGVQRQLKALGIFARLHLRDGKDDFLAVIPPVLDHVIDVARRDAALAGLGAWLEERLRPAVQARLGSLAAAGSEPAAGSAGGSGER